MANHNNRSKNSSKAKAQGGSVSTCIGIAGHLQPCLCRSALIRIT